MQDHYQVVIVGGGSAGITVAALLANEPVAPEMAIIEPSDKHYYQPIWTLVGAGVFSKEVSERDEADFIPPGATWIQDAVTTFNPDHRGRGGDSSRRKSGRVGEGGCRQDHFPTWMTSMIHSISAKPFSPRRQESIGGGRITDADALRRHGCRGFYRCCLGL